jgi:hypothetical protein
MAPNYFVARKGLELQLGGVSAHGGRRGEEGGSDVRGLGKKGGG